MMDQPIEPSILDAIEQGRGQRGRKSPASLVAPSGTGADRGAPGDGAHPHRWGVRAQSGAVSTLCEEACDAVLRGGAVSEAADSVCATRWRGWCETGDTDACDRLRRG